MFYLDTTTELKTLLEKALEKTASENGAALPENFAVRLERPRQEGHGDWATNAAMQLAKPLGKNPRELAQQIVAALGESTLVASAEVAGPGFINLRLSSDWIAGAVKTILAKGENFGHTNDGKGEKVQLEFVSANPTGPLHMGHGRGAAVGDITARLLKFAGYDVTREYYVNDAGLQMELLGKSARARYFEALGREAEAPMPEDGYQGEYLADIAKRYVEKYGESLALKPEEEQQEFFTSETAKIVIESIRKDLSDFGVDFDVWFSEKSLYTANAVPEALESLKKAGYAYEQEQAVWFKSTAFDDDKDRVLIRANGVPTYFMSDVAYLKNKYDRGFEKLIYVWGADHHGYIPRIRSVNTSLGHTDKQLEVLLIQMVNLLRDGKPVQMSKRAGTIVTLREIMDEVGRDATRFFFVMRKSDSTLDFDLELAKKASSENPVFYVQYAYARICSIYRELKERGAELPDVSEFDAGKLSSANEIRLAKVISRMPEEISKAAAELAPHRIAYYAQEIAESFHAFYNSSRILGAEEDVMKARLLLVEAARIVLRSVLEILGISAPEKM